MNKICDSIESITELLEKHKQLIVSSKCYENQLDEDFSFTSESVQNLTRLPSASNYIYKVDFVYKFKSHSIIFRKFTNKLVNFQIENAISQKLSDNGDGPFCFFQ